jgi:hypothetical protein
MGERHPDYAHAMLEIFAGKDPGMILWQPRIDFWYSVNKVRGTLPAHMKDFSLLDLYDYCHASIRYFVDPLRVHYNNVQITRKDLDDKLYQLTWETPVGILTEVLHYDDYRLSAYNSEYRLKTAEDFKVLEYIRQNETWSWDHEAYERKVAHIGNLGVPQFYFRRSPVQGLFIENMGFENAILFMYDHPEVVERFIEVCAVSDEPMYAVLCQSPTPIMNFGENIDAYMDPPTIWRRHLIPYYRHRNAQLQKAGKYTHIHIDGAMRRLLKDISESPFDGIEACTPLPQGDVSIQEIKIALGTKVLLDGIPAVFFMDTFSFEDIRTCVRELADSFYPRLVLGISDELPPNADIERVRLVGEMIQDMV